MRFNETVGSGSTFLQSQRHTEAHWETCLSRRRRPMDIQACIFKLMPLLYTSLAFALQSNTELLKESSSGFQDLGHQITTKNFSGKQSDHQSHIKFAMKMAAKMIIRYNHNYRVNPTMCNELNFLLRTLLKDSGIIFETLIAHLIPRIPTASIVGDSSLSADGEYSITLKF